MTVTRADNGLLENNARQATQGLFFTVLLGIYFTAVQAYEYVEAPFTTAGPAYGSTFFMETGFHGPHVLIGQNIPNYMSTTTYDITLLIKSPLRI